MRVGRRAIERIAQRQHDRAFAGSQGDTLRILRRDEQRDDVGRDRLTVTRLDRIHSGSRREHLDVADHHASHRFIALSRPERDDDVDAGAWHDVARYADHFVDLHRQGAHPLGDRRGQAAAGLERRELSFRERLVGDHAVDESTVHHVFGLGEAVRHRAARRPGHQLHVVLGDKRTDGQVARGDDLIQAAHLDFADRHLLDGAVDAETGERCHGHGHEDYDERSGAAIHFLLLLTRVPSESCSRRAVSLLEPHRRVYRERLGVRPRAAHHPDDRADEHEIVRVSDHHLTRVDRAGRRTRHRDREHVHDDAGVAARDACARVRRRHATSLEVVAHPLAHVSERVAGLSEHRDPRTFARRVGQHLVALKQKPEVDDPHQDQEQQREDQRHLDQLRAALGLQPAGRGIHLSHSVTINPANTGTAYARRGPLCVASVTSGTGRGPSDRQYWHIHWRLANACHRYP